MTIRNSLTKIAVGIAAAALLSPMLALAETTSYVQDTNFTVAGHAFVIKDGSVADSLTISDTSFTVSVPAGDQLDVRMQDAHNVLENDAGLPTCNVMKDYNNQMFIEGPRTVTVTPSTSLCSSSDASTNGTPVFVFSTPVNGASVKAEASYDLFWSSEGRPPASLRLRLSTDGGHTYPTVIADNLLSNGYYSWDVPQMTSTDSARLKIEAINSGSVVGFNVSPTFSIAGTAPVVTPPPTTTPPPSTTPPAPAHYDAFDAEAQTAAATSIDVDRSFVAAPTPASGTTVCVVGTRIKGTSTSAVYYCGRDLKRHAFPNQRIHDSWYTDFNGVVTLSDAVLAQIPLGKDATYRPGVRMIKLQTDPKTYAVSSGGVLRWVQDEATAQAIYGADWNKKIDDVSDAFFFDYTVGDPLPQYVVAH